MKEHEVLEPVLFTIGQVMQPMRFGILLLD
jgi:hypothetical protein